MNVTTLQANMQDPFALDRGVPFHPMAFPRGYIEYKDKCITGTLQGETLLTDELEECGCCGSCHQATFAGDCRQDDCRFPTWEWSEMFD